MNPTAVTRTINLDKARELQFNLNTFTAFEKETGQFFLDAILGIQAKWLEIAKVKPNVDAEDVQAAEAAALQRNLTFMRQISLATIRALVWAACHEYRTIGGKRQPYWPLSIDEVGQYLSLPGIAPLVQMLIAGAFSAMPQEGDTEKTNEAARPTSGGESNLSSGGSPSGGLDGEILDSLTLT